MPSYKEGLLRAFVFIFDSIFDLIYVIYISALCLFQAGLYPFWLPHTGGRPPCPLSKVDMPQAYQHPFVARGTRGDTLVVSCTLRLPRRNCITKAYW